MTTRRMFRMFSQARRVSLCGVAALASAALLACGGPKPIDGSNNSTGGAGSGTNDGAPITAPGTSSTNTNTTTSGGGGGTAYRGGRRQLRHPDPGSHCSAS